MLVCPSFDHHIRPLLTGLVMLAVCCQAAPVVAQTARELSEQASAACEQKEWEKAEQLSEELLVAAKRQFDGDTDKLQASSYLACYYIDQCAEGHLAADALDDALRCVKRARQLFDNAGRPKELAADVAQTAGDVYVARENYPKALEYYRWLQKVRETYEGKDDPTVADALDEQADVYEFQEEWKSAEALYRRALEIKQNALGHQHPSVGWRHYELAWNLRRQEEYQQAESHLHSAIEISTTSDGSDDRLLAQSLNCIADIHSSQEEYEEAETFYRRELALREKMGGLDHPRVAKLLLELARNCDRLNRPREAQRLCRRAVEIQEKIHGPDHPTVASMLQILALHHLTQSEYEQAESLFHRTLQILKKAYGAEHDEVASVLDELAALSVKKNDVETAESMFRQALTIRERLHGSVHAELAKNLNSLASLYAKQGRFKLAEDVLMRQLRIQEQIDGEEQLEVAAACFALAENYVEQDNFGDAELVFQRALEIMERNHGPEHLNVAVILERLARIYGNQSRNDEEESAYKRVIRIREKLYGEDHPSLLGPLFSLAGRLSWQGQRDESLSLATRARSIAEGAFGPKDVEFAQSLCSLSRVFSNLNMHEESRSTCHQAVQICYDLYGPEHVDSLFAIEALAHSCQYAGLNLQGVQHHRDALAICEKAFGISHPRSMSCLNNLAICCGGLGRYAEAIVMYKKVIAGSDESPGMQAFALNNLAGCYRARGEFFEAERTQKKALRIKTQVFGRESNPAATSMANLAEDYVAQHRYGEARRLLDEASRIFTKISEFGHVAAVRQDYAKIHLQLGQPHKALEVLREVEASQILDDTPYGNDSFNLTLADAMGMAGRPADASQLIRDRFMANDSAPGDENILAGSAYFLLARCAYQQSQPEAAVDDIDRAIRIQERLGVSPVKRYQSYHLRAQITWDLHRQNEAISDLDHALSLAEQARVNFSGSQMERAVAFSQFSDGFEQMIDWQNSMDNLSAVFAAIERARMRTLLDDMVHARADLQAGRSALERDAITHKESELKEQAAALEKKLEQSSDALPSERRHELQSRLTAVRQALYDHYREERSSSPVYRDLLSMGGRPPRLSQLQRSLARNETLLIYSLGVQNGYLLSLRSDVAKCTTLSVNKTDAETLGITAGPLTAARLKKALHHEANTGVLQLLANPDTATSGTKQLKALWRTLIPEHLRDRILAGESASNADREQAAPIQRLIVIPDGPLSLLPFETLVVGGTIEDPTYLLDAGPPIHYSPSATVLYNLIQRRASPTDAAAAQVLSVGDPHYGTTAQVTELATNDDVLDSLTPRSRFGGVTGDLAPLPHSAVEVGWVVDAFEKAGMPSTSLTGSSATESRVREELSGRRIVHLACHGLVDNEFGNLFGALALTPTDSSSEPANDGLLTLAEMHSLDLKSCDLAILSACQTNYGPQQKGEGVWAISRGFLVAGARRVVASNWLVDDEAAASLIGYFCGGIANAEQNDEAPDYVTSLHRAKKWVRDQKQWSSPYYWGTFVLVGPN